MDLQPSNPLREKDDVNKREIPSDTTPRSNSTNSNVDQQFTVAMPALVSELFLRDLRSVQLLKTCRFVCKSWNIEASNTLRARSKISLEEASKKFEKFAMLMAIRALGPSQDLPSPFHYAHLKTPTFTDPNFNEFALNIPITSLSLDLDRRDADGLCLNQLQLFKVLAANNANITNLEIRASVSRGFVLEKNTLKDRYKVTCLKSLKFYDWCSSCTHTEFMQNILDRCQPETLDLWIFDKESVARLLAQHTVGNLKTLKLSFRRLSQKAWSHVGNLRFSSLRNVTFRKEDTVSTPYRARQWHSFCQNVSPLLEEFETNLPIYFKPELSFPNLKSLRMIELIDGKHSLSSFTPDRFPSLVKVTFGFKTPLDIIIVQNGIPHRDVSSLDLSINGYNEDNDSFNNVLMHLLSCMSWQFPQVFSLQFSSRNFYRTTIPDILEAFPKITALDLDGICNFSSLSGMNESTVTKYMEQGLPIERIPHRKSITDFMELETIRFGPKFRLDTSMIQYCLPRVPKLRQISFYWNSSLSAPLLRDAIGHLERIVICNSTKNVFQDAMAKVAEMLPNALIE